MTPLFYRKSVGIALLLASAVSFAGSCELQITRTACAGKEEISYKKCDGKASCSEFLEVADAGACQAEAVKACENKRLSTTKEKVIKAQFDGAAVKSASGGDDFCADFADRATQFDKCDTKE